MILDGGCSQYPSYLGIILDNVLDMEITTEQNNEKSLQGLLDVEAFL
jgi:hypothetical protein